MGALALESLEIRRFRPFEHLEIPRLGRVNLITGKNNVGKSSLLEALWLYARRGSPVVIRQILEERNEFGATPGRAESDMDLPALSVRYLFHGRPDLPESSRPIQIGPLRRPADTLTLSVGWYAVRDDALGQRQWTPLMQPEVETAEDAALVLATHLGTNESSYQRLDSNLRRQVRPAENRGIPAVWVTANGLDAQQIGSLWDAIALTNFEKDVVESLRIIAPDVMGINLVGDSQDRRGRAPIVRMSGLSNPIPLRSAGEGMNRIFGIVLALVNVQNGLLLVDEIESGLHYSAQPDLWKLIFAVAARLNVQVFATTHSWDCIEAFQQAAQSSTTVEGLLIRLEQKRGDMRVTVFDEDKLAVATRAQIEMR